MDSGNAEAEIQLIWQEHQLGEIQQLIPLPCQGNQRFVVNGSHIVHLSAGDSAVNGLRSEAEAYRILASSLPVPEMVLYDESRQVIPRSFLITICPPGSPVSESWPWKQAGISPYCMVILCRASLPDRLMACLTVTDTFRISFAE